MIFFVALLKWIEIWIVEIFPLIEHGTVYFDIDYTILSSLYIGYISIFFNQNEIEYFIHQEIFKQMSWNTWDDPQSVVIFLSIQ